VGGIGERPVVVLHQPRAHLIRTAIAVDGADRRAIGLVVAAVDPEQAVEAGAAETVRVAAAGLSDRLGGAGRRRLADRQGGSRPLGHAPLTRRAVLLARAGGGRDLRRRRALP